MSNLIETEQVGSHSGRSPQGNPIPGFLSLILQEPTAGAGERASPVPAPSPPTACPGPDPGRDTGSSGGLNKAPRPLPGPQHCQGRAGGSASRQVPQGPEAAICGPPAPQPLAAPTNLPHKTPQDDGYPTRLTVTEEGHGWPRAGGVTHTARPEGTGEDAGGCVRQEPSPGAQRRTGGRVEVEVAGEQALGTVPRPSRRGQGTRARPSAAVPLSPAAAAAWPASGLGSGPSCSLSCTGSSRGRGPGPPASRSGSGGGGEERSSPSAAPEMRTRPGVAPAAPRKSPRLHAASGAVVAGAPHAPQLPFPPPQGAGLAPARGTRDKDPGPRVCNPRGTPGQRPPPGPRTRLGWKHSARPGCQLPVPDRGMRCWRPHDSSPGQLRPRPAGPHPAQHLRAARKHM